MKSASLRVRSDPLPILIRRFCRDRRGNIAVFFAVSLVALVICISAAIDMARLADGRANLQIAADNAATSGAAAYSEGGAVFNTLGITIATTAFCNATATIPEGFTIVTSGTANGMTAETCGANAGPSVSATTDAYTPGTVGYAPNNACTTTIQGNNTFTCGFVVTVTATATMPSLVPALFGASRTVKVTAAAANPFINFAKTFAGTTIASGAKYANSVWVYALLLNANGQPDYATNPGAVPDATTCLSGGGPDYTTCGAGAAETGSVSAGYIAPATTAANFIMLANTEYANTAICSGACTTSSPAFTSPLSGISYVGGVVQNPPTPPGITSTTPLGVAFQGIAGGNLFYNSATELTSPGLYGYDPLIFGGSQYVTASVPTGNGCAFPYDNLVYHTIGQVWQTLTNPVTGVKTPAPLLPWSDVTHWFYSSALANPVPQPPSYLEIGNQTINGEVVRSVPQDPAQQNGNIAGTPTYNATPYQQAPPAPLLTPVQTVAAKCTPTTTYNGTVYLNTLAQTTGYITSGADNCSLFIAQSTTAGSPTPAVASHDGACFTPAGTPGAQYAAQSCQAYGSYYYFFYWNDMGGSGSGTGLPSTDNLNYGSSTTVGDGTVVLHCASSSHIVLIQ